MNIGHGLGIALVSLCSCVVPAARYDQAVLDATHAHEESSHLQSAARTEIHNLQAQLAETQAKLQQREVSLSELKASIHNLQARLDEATAIHQQLQGELERTGKDVGAMLKEKGTLQQALDDARARLAELRDQQAAAQARNAAMNSLMSLLKTLIDSKELAVSSRGGQTVLAAAESVLFEPGRAELKPSADRVLRAVAKAVSASPGWRYRIVAFTAPPPRPSQFRNALELSAARATQVANSLIGLGVSSDSLSVAGFGDLPTGPTTTSAQSSALGRVEIQVEAAR